VAITTYAELQAAIADWVERGDLTSRLPAFVANAEAKANRWLRDQKLEAQDAASVDTALTALPQDFAAVITVQLRLGASEPYSRLDPALSDVLASYDSDVGARGRPRFYGLLGPQLQLYPAPDRAYAVLLTYFAKLPALSDTNTTNWLLEDAPDVYLDGSLAGFYEFDRDFEAANRYLQKFEAGLGELRDARRRPTGKLRVDAALQRQRNYDITRDI
jgi:hypothetical protein